MDFVLDLIGRQAELFGEDVSRHEAELRERVSASAFLVIGGAGSIGQAVCKEIFRRGPRALHVVDISENNLVELVRDLRGSLGYIDGDFRTFAVDIGSVEFDALLRHEGPYDYVLNLSALKHVRSEKDPYTLMRMIDVNVLNTEKTLKQAADFGAKKYFCVSTDKATNPVNMMGCSKRIMEQFLMRRSLEVPVSTARFANVAFSDGSLLHGFNQRIQKRQPISAPNDVRRYFVTPKESGELCLMSCLLGENRDIFFPKLSEQLHLITFDEIARRYLRRLGYEPVECESEEAARAAVETLSKERRWPCYFSASDTTGEKDFEEFFTEGQQLDMARFENLGVIRNDADFDNDRLAWFVDEIGKLKAADEWDKEWIVHLFQTMVPEFEHRETGRYLDGKM
ncbi:MAG TPA: NAD-dependent epimerase/dehydratase family protein [Gammaproteobacteria bacterium]|nr:NAD-dependent epimerase/dehydratase family protein [Gammaproteobacteria bacterium]